MENPRKDFIIGFTTATVLFVVAVVSYLYIDSLGYYAPKSSNVYESQALEKTVSSDLNDTKSTATSGGLKIHVVEGLVEKPFTSPVHVDLFMNGTVIYAVDSQDGSTVSFKDAPFGVYKSRVRAIGFVDSINTFTYKDDKSSEFNVIVKLSR